MAKESTVETTTRDGLATIRLAREHGNAINDALVDDLASAARAAASDPDIRGVLLASRGKLFSPGLDLQDLVLLDRKAMDGFMTRFRDMLLDLYTLPKPVVAAISGAAMAGGCILSLTADWRVLRRGAPIGLNEIKVGVPLPLGVARLLAASVGRARLEEVALFGRNYQDDGAIASGLAHELHDEAGFEEHCRERLDELALKDPPSFAATKSYLRSAVAAEIASEGADHRKAWLDCWFSRETRGRIERIVTGLKERSA